VRQSTRAQFSGLDFSLMSVPTARFCLLLRLDFLPGSQNAKSHFLSFFMLESFLVSWSADSLLASPSALLVFSSVSALRLVDLRPVCPVLDRTWPERRHVLRSCL
jgi:hypothetical protein